MNILKFREAGYGNSVAVVLPPVPMVGKGRRVWLRAKELEWAVEVIKVTSFNDRAVVIVEFESEQQFKQFKQLKPITGELLE